MQLLNPRRHRPLEPIHLARARVQAALEPELDLLPFLVDGGADDEEAVGRSQGLVAGRVAAADGDGGGCLFDDFEVVCDLGAFVVGAGRELLVCPELLGGLGATPFKV